MKTIHIRISRGDYVGLQTERFSGGKLLGWRRNRSRPDQPVALCTATETCARTNYFKLFMDDCIDGKLHAIKNGYGAVSTHPMQIYAIHIIRNDR